MRRILLPLLLLFAFTQQSHAAGIVVSPAQLGLIGAPGTTVSGVINVSSPRPQENRIQVSFGAYETDAQGTRGEVTADKAGPRAASAWLSVDQDQFASPQRGTVPIVVTAHIPENASGSYWAAAYFQVVPIPPSFDPAAPRPKVGLQVLPRLGVPVIITVKGTEKYAVSVREMMVDRNANGLNAKISVENSGNAAVVISGAIAVERPSNDVPEELASKDVEAITSYPGSVRVITVSLPLVGGDPNAILLHAYLRYGPGTDQTVEASAPLARLLERSSATTATRR